jgi:hypothetical protein
MASGALGWPTVPDGRRHRTSGQRAVLTVSTLTEPFSIKAAPSAPTDRPRSIRQADAGACWTAWLAIKMGREYGDAWSDNADAFSQGTDVCPRLGRHLLRRYCLVCPVAAADFHFKHHFMIPICRNRYGLTAPIFPRRPSCVYHGGKDKDKDLRFRIPDPDNWVRHLHETIHPTAASAWMSTACWTISLRRGAWYRTPGSQTGAF